MSKLNMLVSVVIPVYNAESYLECCIESIVRQTYSNIEILLLNDGSKDKSGNICQKWVEIDGRIKYYEHLNMRQGPTETKGLKLATGKYITFVDSDDWIDERFVELTLKEIVSEQADICECCWCKYNEKISMVIAVMPNIKTDIEDSYRYKYPHFWGRLYRREFLISNNICLPPYPHQDLATYPIVAFLAKKICYVDEPLYFYRMNYETNVTNKIKYKFFYDKVFRHLYMEFKRLDLIDRAQKVMGEIIIAHLRVKLRNSRRLGKKEYDFVKKESISLLNEYYPDWKKKYKNKYWVWGSYNSSRIAENIMLDFDRMGTDSHFYWMSSIISLMSKPVDSSWIWYDNKLRKQAVQRDCTKEFLKSDILESDYLIIDFLEERFDIFQLSEETYLTYSETFEDINEFSGKIISRKSHECEELWRKSCDKFVEFLKRTVKDNHVILIEMYLNSKSVNYAGNVDIVDVSNVNSILKKYYEYFKSKMDDIFVITIPEELCYTDAGFEYGDFPYYYSDMAYYEISKQLENLC